MRFTQTSKYPYPSNGSNVFVTGANGFLGSHFTLRLAQMGVQQIHALVRGTTDSIRSQRISLAIQRAAKSCGQSLCQDHDTIHVIEGDVRRPSFGFNRTTMNRLSAARISQVWHFASDLRFENRFKHDIFETNVVGAKNAMRLARVLGARLIYISTAYTAGRAEGDILEELHPREGPFNNVYEESKCMTEHLLQEESREANVSLTILRPSIVVGPESTRFSEGSNTGLYGFVRAIRQFHANVTQDSGLLRLAATPSVEINFVPVDRVVDDMIGLMSNGFGTQQIYHLTAMQSVTAGQCWEVFERLIGVRNIYLQPRGTFIQSSSERLLTRRIRFFVDYINTHKKFRRHLGEGPVVTPKDFADYVAASIKPGVLAGDDTSYGRNVVMLERESAMECSSE
jgi:nucleoside-diphosphate-sugar epimerase